MIRAHEHASVLSILPFLSKARIYMATAFGRLDISKLDTLVFQLIKIRAFLIRRDVHAKWISTDEPTINIEPALFKASIPKPNQATNDK